MGLGFGLGLGLGSGVGVRGRARVRGSDLQLGVGGDGVAEEGGEVLLGVRHHDLGEAGLKTAAPGMPGRSPDSRSHLSRAHGVGRAHDGRQAVRCPSARLSIADF